MKRRKRVSAESEAALDAFLSSYDDDNETENTGYSWEKCDTEEDLYFDDDDDDDFIDDDDDFIEEKPRRFRRFAGKKKKDNKKETDLSAFGHYNRPIFIYALFFTLSVFLMECVLKVYVYGALFDRGLLLMALFTASLGFFAAVIVNLFKGALSRIVGFLLLFFAAFWIMLQTVYYTIFSAFFTLYSFSGAGDVAEFWKAAVTGILDSWLPLLFMLLPLVLYFVL